jgi:hypothetical protein
MTPDEKRQHEALQAHRALGLLMHMIPVNLPFAQWSIDSRGIEAMYNVHAHKVSNDQARTDMRRLGREFDGFVYAERAHNAGMNKVSIVGSIVGVRVELWVLLEACTCGCHSAVTE